MDHGLERIAVHTEPERQAARLVPPLHGVGNRQHLLGREGGAWALVGEFQVPGRLSVVRHAHFGGGAGRGDADVVEQWRKFLLKRFQGKINKIPRFSKLCAKAERLCIDGLTRWALELCILKKSFLVSLGEIWHTAMVSITRHISWQHANIQTN